MAGAGPGGSAWVRIPLRATPIADSLRGAIVGSTLGDFPAAFLGSMAFSPVRWHFVRRNFHALPADFDILPRNQGLQDVT
jgi:hypothetical protein